MQICCTLLSIRGLRKKRENFDVSAFKASLNGFYSAIVDCVLVSGDNDFIRSSSSSTSLEGRQRSRGFHHCQITIRWCLSDQMSTIFKGYYTHSFFFVGPSFIGKNMCVVYQICYFTLVCVFHFVGILALIVLNSIQNEASFWQQQQKSREQ